MRQHLVIAIQEAQSDLFTVNTALGEKADVITENIFELERSATACTGCHHTPEMTRRLEGVRALIGEYEAALSYYMTASANIERIGKLKLEAAALAAELLRHDRGDGRPGLAGGPRSGRPRRCAGSTRRARSSRITIVAHASSSRSSSRSTSPPRSPARCEALVRATRAIAGGRARLRHPAHRRADRARRAGRALQLDERRAARRLRGAPERDRGAQAGRGAAPLRRVPRRAHRAPEPRAVPRPAPARDRDGPAARRSRSTRCCSSTSTGSR